MTHGSLFNGIGGFQLAAAWMGWENIFSCEIDNFCNQITKKHFPDCIQHGDIKTTDFSIYRGRIDIITGGFPCQPFSVAGKQLGAEDDRFLWYEMLRAIKETEIPFIVGENVTGIVNMALGEVLTTLENEGYQVETFIIPACAINAPHKRERVWIIAYSERIGRERGFGWAGNISEEAASGITITPERFYQASANSNSQHRKEFERGDKLGYERKESSPGRGVYETMWNRNWTEVASELCRVDDGLPKELDARRRISALGNAIVPQIAYEIFKAIEKINELQAKRKISKTV